MLYEKSSALNRKLYSDLSSTDTTTNSNITDLICEGSWASMEAYYTSCTVNVVVLQMQGNHIFKNTDNDQVELNRINYLCSFIENLGDLLKHGNDINASNKTDNMDELKKHILKLSKYIYRIYYSLAIFLDGSSSKSDALETKTKIIKDDLLKYRGSGDIGSVSNNTWSTIGLDATNSPSLETYLTEFTLDIMKLLPDEPIQCETNPNTAIINRLLDRMITPNSTNPTIQPIKGGQKQKKTRKHKNTLRNKKTKKRK
jgi:hypothetical protein